MLIHLPNARVACLTFALALSGCHAKRSVAARQVSPLSPVAQEIQRRGYGAKESLIVPPTPWEVSTFRMRSKRTSSFRADQPLTNSPGYYCRFSFFEEAYDSVDDARHRLVNLHLASPDGPAGEEDYLSAMRTGFRVGNVTYVLQTDASMFWDEVQRFARELATAMQGADLSRVIIDDRRANRWTRAVGARFAT
jgi:hypothetical protein